MSEHPDTGYVCEHCGSTEQCSCACWQAQAAHPRPEPTDTWLEHPKPQEQVRGPRLELPPHTDRKDRLS